MIGCGANPWKPSPEPPPKPIDCDAQALQACEAPEIEPEGAPLAISEEVDEVNRHRWLRCILRHTAALACFAALRAEGVLQGAAPAGESQRGR